MVEKERSRSISDLLKHPMANAEGRPVSPVLDSCAARDLVAGAGRCSEALMDMLYELAGGTIEERDQDWLQMERQQHEARLREACKDVRQANPQASLELDVSHRSSL